MLLERPCIRCRYSTSDRRLAAQWFQQGIELEDVRQSVFLGCGRKYVSWLNGLPGLADHSGDTTSASQPSFARTRRVARGR